MVTGVAIAAATKPGAGVDDVLGAIFDICDPDVVTREIDKQLKYTGNCSDFRELRKAFDTVYGGFGIPYSSSYANEVVTKAICIFKMVKGNTKEAILAGVNLGRDTDCLAAVAAGISGSLTGVASVPKEWIEQSDKATSLNIYTNSQRTLKQNGDGLYDAFKKRLSKMNNYSKIMDVD